MLLSELDTLLKLPGTYDLHFVGNPVTDGPYVFSDFTQSSGRVDSPYALMPGSERNRVQSHVENYLRVITGEIKTWLPSVEKQEVEEIVRAVYGMLEVQRALAWQSQREAENRNIIHTELFFAFKLPADTFIAACHLTVLALSAYSKLTHVAGRVLLAGWRSAAEHSESTRHLLPDLARDPRTILAGSYLLDPLVDRYLSCPRCFELYPLASVTPTTRAQCNYKATPDSTVCNAELWHLRGQSPTPVPVAVFDHQRFKEWLGRLLSRRGIEDLCETAYTGEQQTLMKTERDGSRVFSILDPHGNPFLPGPPGSELRLVFSWSGDGWNPYGNKAAGIAASSNGFWLVCMSLPIDIRYLEENVFFCGATSGKPKGSRFNPVLELIVAAFLDLWNPGVRYTRTAKYALGRLVRAIVVPQISDVMGTRQVSGRGAVKVRNFCMFCLLERDEIESCDRAAFLPRDDAKHRELAQRWKDAATDEERDELEKAHDIRWYPFLRLPYHSPTRDNIPCAMHLFKEGLIQCHIRECLGVHIVIDGVLRSKEKATKARPRPAPALMDEANSTLQAIADGQPVTVVRRTLEGYKKTLLWHLCRDRDLRYAGTKRQLVRSLVEWESGSSEGVNPAAVQPTGDEWAAGSMPSTSDSESDLDEAIGAPYPSAPNTESADTDTDTDTDTAMDIEVSIDDAEGALPDWAVTLTPLSDSEKELLLSDGVEKIIRSVNKGNAPATVAGKGVIAELQVICKALRIDVGGTKPTLAQRLLYHVASTGRPLRSFRDRNENVEGSVFNAGASSTDAGGNPPMTSSSALSSQDVEILASPDADRLAKALLSRTAKVESLKSYARKKVFVSFCKRYGLESGTVDEMAQSLWDYAEANFPRLRKTRKLDPSGPRRQMLNTEVMMRIWENMALTVLPSFVDTVPRDWGTAGRGKLTAEQWFIILLVHLPVTLIQLWGTEAATEREKSVLANTMQLVDAVCLAYYKELTEEDILEYEDVIRDYFEGKKALYKDVTIKPNDHLALHYGDVLRAFGPTAAHDGPYFERFIRRLHGFNTNMKRVELETTYMRSSARAANLRALLLDDCALLDRVSHLVEEVRRQSLSDPRGTRLGSLMLESSVLSSREGAKVLRKGSREVALPSDILRMLVGFLRERHPEDLRRTSISPRALVVSRAAIRNATFAPAPERERDSHVLFRIAKGVLGVGRITYMFLHEGSSGPVATELPALFVVIEPYEKLSAEEQWMDKNFRLFKRGGLCCKPTFSEKVIITASDVLCHVAKTAIKLEGVTQPLLHMLPLGKLAEVLPQIRAADLLYSDEI